MRLERLDVQEELAFVVDRAAREDLSVAHRRLERRAVPELERLGGLHVVVAVDEHRRRARRRLAPFADDDRMARRRDASSPSRPIVAQRLGDPLGGARGVGVVLGARADARDAEQVEQLVADARRRWRRRSSSRSAASGITGKLQWPMVRTVNVRGSAVRVAERASTWIRTAAWNRVSVRAYWSVSCSVSSFPSRQRHRATRVECLSSGNSAAVSRGFDADLRGREPAVVTRPIFDRTTTQERNGRLRTRSRRRRPFHSVKAEVARQHPAHGGVASSDISRRSSRSTASRSSSTTCCAFCAAPGARPADARHSRPDDPEAPGITRLLDKLETAGLASSRAFVAGPPPGVLPHHASAGSPCSSDSMRTMRRPTRRPSAISTDAEQRQLIKLLEGVRAGQRRGDTPIDSALTGQRANRRASRLAPRPPAFRSSRAPRRSATSSPRRAPAKIRRERPHRLVRLPSESSSASTRLSPAARDRKTAATDRTDSVVPIGWSRTSSDATGVERELGRLLIAIAAEPRASRRRARATTAARSASAREHPSSRTRARSDPWRPEVAESARRPARR